MEEKISQKQAIEINERLTRIETILTERLGGYPDMVTMVTNLCSEISGIKKDHVHLDERVSDMEEDHKWITRLVLGAVVLAIVAVVLSGKGGLP
jgi:hypothetical protein